MFVCVKCQVPSFTPKVLVWFGYPPPPPFTEISPLKSKKITNMGRKGPRAKTKTVLKSVSKMQQLGSMPNLRFSTLSK